MPDPVTGTVLGGAQLGGTLLQHDASKRASKQQTAGLQAGIDEQRAARQSFEQRTDPFRQLGLQAANPLSQMLGFGGGQPAAPRPQVFQDNEGEILSLAEGSNIPAHPTLDRFGNKSPSAPGGVVIPDPRPAEPIEPQAQQAGDPLDINPIVKILRDEGFRDIQESAAARGRLGAGGTLRDLTKFNTQLATTVAPQLQQQKFNQLFNVLGLGANVASGQGTAALQTGSNISNLLGGIGQAQAGGTIGRANAITGGIQGAAGALGSLGSPF